MLMSKIADLLGKPDDARQYTALSDTIKDAFITRFFRPETYTFGLDSVFQTYQLLAVFGDLLPEGIREATLKTIVDDIQKRGNHLNTGIVGTKYLWRVLSDAGYDDLAFSIATQETYPSYGYWRNNHATTLLESWSGNSSHNHQMFGAVSEYLYQYLAGIRSPFGAEEARGYRQIHLQPCMPDTLRKVEASLQTVAGTIRSGWERFDSHYVYEVTIPSNTTATLELPAKGYGSATKITEGNTVVWKEGAFSDTDPGIKEIKRDDVKFYVSLESGTYRFVVTK
jgi:alpha-L-rhamnosidase